MNNKNLYSNPRPSANRLLLAAGLTFGLIGTASAIPVQVTVQNLSSENGLFLTPVWVGFHDGSFDMYNQGEPILVPGLESLAEDGNTAPLSDDFAAAQPAGVDGVVLGAGGPLAPGEVAPSVTFELDPTDNAFFSYASMVIPSNDAFIANGDPLAFELFDAGGMVNEITFIILGAAILDAGTEANLESEGTAFLNQTGPNEGDADPDSNVRPHEGFIGSDGGPAGTPIILGATTAGPGGDILIDSIAGDFTLPDFAIAQITISAGDPPAPVSITGTMSLFGLGLVGMLAARRRLK